MNKLFEEYTAEEFEQMHLRAYGMDPESCVDCVIGEQVAILKMAEGVLIAVHTKHLEKVS